MGLSQALLEEGCIGPSSFVIHEGRSLIHAWHPQYEVAEGAVHRRYHVHKIQIIARLFSPFDDPITTVD